MYAYIFYPFRPNRYIHRIGVWKTLIDNGEPVTNQTRMTYIIIASKKLSLISKMLTDKTFAGHAQQAKHQKTN